MPEIAVFVCSHVFDRSRPVLLASRADGDWQMLCGEEHDEDDGPPRVIGLNHIIEQDDTLEAILDLPNDWEAERASSAAPWQRRHCETE